MSTRLLRTAQKLAHACLLATAIFLGKALAPGALEAQLYTLALSTQTVTIPAPTASDYSSGFSAASQTITYTVTGSGFTGARNATVRIKSASAVFAGGKAVSDVQWQLAGTNTWTSLTTVDSRVHSRPLQQSNPSFTGTIYFRVVLRWESDPPGEYSITINLSLSV